MPAIASNEVSNVFFLIIMKHRWSHTQKYYIKENCGKMTDSELARKLGTLMNRRVTTFAVRKQRQKMGLKKMCGRGKCELDERKDKQ